MEVSREIDRGSKFSSNRPETSITWPWVNLIKRGFYLDLGEEMVNLRMS